MTSNMTQRHLVTDQCPVCNKPVYADQGYFTTTKAHADCHTTKNDLSASTEAIDAIFEELGFLPKRRIRPVGQGKTATKLKERITQLIETQYSQKAKEALIWGQLGSYRGPKWDLASWGVDITLESGLKVSVCSWLTMTAALKYKKIKLTNDSTMPHCYEV